MWSSSDGIVIEICSVPQRLAVSTCCQITVQPSALTVVCWLNSCGYCTPLLSLPQHSTAQHSAATADGCTAAWSLRSASAKTIEALLERTQAPMDVRTAAGSPMYLLQAHTAQQGMSYARQHSQTGRDMSACPLLKQSQAATGRRRDGNYQAIVRRHPLWLFDMCSISSVGTTAQVLHPPAGPVHGAEQGKKTRESFMRFNGGAVT